MLYRLVFPESTLQVFNRGASPVAVSLHGPIERSFSVSTASEAFSVFPGTYSATASSGECRPVTNTFTVDEEKSYTLDFSCVFSPAQPGVSTVSYIVENNTGSSVEVAITGSVSVTYHMPPGIHSIELEPGAYHMHTTASCGQRDETLSVRYGERQKREFHCTSILRPY
jgi:hypothetical protein